MAAPPRTATNSPWNGTPGAVQAPYRDATPSMGDQVGTNAAGKDAIREGKQRARETMAGLGRNLGTADAPANVNGPAQLNGGPQLSRKRSRDGSQLPADRRIASKEGSSEPKEHNEVLLDRYIQRDMIHGAAMNDQAERSRALIQDKEREKEWLLHDVRQHRQNYPGTIFGPGYQGYGNHRTHGRTEIQYCSNRPAPKGRVHTRHLYIQRKDNAQQAERHEELVPIRLDLELDKLRIRDTFTWNLHEKIISTDQFTEYLLEDLQVPEDAKREVANYVKQEIHEQTQNFYPHMIVEDGPLDPSKPYNEHKDDEMRILIKLNITIGRISLVDQFEWDINNPLNSPEEFARHMAQENALSGEFTTAIAHSIREQSQMYTKSLYLTNHCFDGRPVEDPELRDAFLPAPLHGVFRPMQQHKDWMPYMYEMSENEVERVELAMMREHRAQKRQLNRRGGPALPDLKERLRTVRSLLVHKVIPGAVESFETTGIPKVRRSRAGRRGVRVDDDADSDDLGTDDSGPDSPAPSMLNAGTTRTRGMRGAASAATAAMRAIGRSATPDSQLLATPQDLRGSARRSGLREESVAGNDDEDDTLIVKLKIGRTRLRNWLNDYEAKKRASQYPLSGYASLPMPAAPAKGVAAATLNTPGQTPAKAQARSTPQPNGNHQRALSRNRKSAQPQQSTPAPPTYDADGRVDIDKWPAPDESPPPPPWLDEAIETLRARHPDSNFGPMMRPYTVSRETNATVRLPGGNPDPGEGAPHDGVKLQFHPKIKCFDCPNKLYTAAPGKVIDDFEVHLRNRSHREKVQIRLNSHGRE